MNMRQKIKKSLFQINRFLQNADDATLDYLKMSDEQRNTILNCTHDIYKDDSVYSMAIDYNPEKNHADIFYNPDINELDQNNTTKIVIHEVGHVFERLRQDDKLAKIANSFPLNLLYQHKDRFDLAVSLISLVSLEFLPGVSNAINMGLTALGGLGLYPARKMEIKCDDLSDKILPEITYGEESNATAKLKGDVKNKFTQMLGNFNAFFSTHPSEAYRSKRSKIKCAEYLKTKNELKIASIYAPNNIPKAKIA